MKFLGVGADIHFNRFSDVKYIQELREEFAEAKTKPLKVPTTTVAGPQTVPTAPLVVPPISTAPAVVTQPKADPTYEPFPKDNERAAFVTRLRKVIANSNTEAVKAYVLKEAKVAKTDDLTVPAWEKVLKSMEAVSSDPVKLKALLVGA
jgi:hypothetical protein